MKRVRSIDRALLVIETLSTSGSMSLVQLRQHTGLDNATLLRILTTMMDRGWVRQLIVEKKYELSHSLGKTLGEQSRAYPIAELAAPILLELKGNRLGLPSDLCAITGAGLFEVVESTRLRGPMAPARTGLGLQPSLFRSAHGRAILAALPKVERDKHIDAFLNRARKEDVAWYRQDHLDNILEETSNNGYGLRQEKYWEPPFDESPPIGAIAIAIVTSTGVHGSISILWLEEHLSLEEVMQAGLIDELAQAVGRITKILEDNNIVAPVIDGH